MMNALSEDYEPWYPKGSTFIIDPDRTPKDDDLAHTEVRPSVGEHFQHFVLPAKRARQRGPLHYARQPG
jgi:hypothetical protein